MTVFKRTKQNTTPVTVPIGDIPRVPLSGKTPPEWKIWLANINAWLRNSAAVKANDLTDAQGEKIGDVIMNRVGPVVSVNAVITPRAFASGDVVSGLTVPPAFSSSLLVTVIGNEEVQETKSVYLPAGEVDMIFPELFEFGKVLVSGQYIVEVS